MKMAKPDGSKNGSEGANILADAMQQVFREAVEAGVQPLTDLMVEMDEKMVTKDYLNEQLETTNQNVQAQLSQHLKDIDKG